MEQTEEIIGFLYEDVIRFHDELERSGESIRNGVRDEGLIQSALHAPFQTIFGSDAYPSIFSKAARLGYFLAMDHGFEDGNKRTALHSMLTFLLVNGIELTYEQEEIADLICDVVEKKVSAEELEKWLEVHAND